MVVSTAQTSDQHKGLKLFFWESNCMQHMPVFRVVAPQPDHFSKGACCKEKLLSFVQKHQKPSRCTCVSQSAVIGLMSSLGMRLCLDFL